MACKTPVVTDLERQLMSDNCRDHIQNHYKVDVMVDKYIELYNSRNDK